MSIKQLIMFIIWALIAVTTTAVANKASAEGFTLVGKDISGQLPFDYVLEGCGGKGLSPELTWTNPPAETKSFAITAYDPDAPTGSGFWHWVVFNLPKDTHKIKKNAGIENSKLLPKEAIQSITSAGEMGFAPACPPEGDPAHRYIFTVYALDIESLDLEETDQPAWVGYHLNKHAIAKSAVIAYLKR